MVPNSPPKSEKTRSQIIASDQRWEPESIARIPVMQQISGRELGRVVLLNTQQPLIFGREATCDVVFSDEICSRKHAEIRTITGSDGLPTVMIRDLKSSNGTRISEQRLTPHQEYPWPADLTLEIGGAVRFQLSLMRQDDAETLEWVSRSPHRDPATSLLTRRGFVEALDRETQHLARQPQESIALVMLRIFDFADELVAKKTDATLRHWVESLLPRVRSGTVLGRTSEYEVMALLRHCDTEGANAAMKRYRTAILEGIAAVQAPQAPTGVEPAIGGVLITGKYNPAAPNVLHFCETELFKHGHPGDSLKLIEYVPATAANTKRR